MNLLKPATLEFWLPTRSRRSVFLLAIGLPAFFLILEALRVAAASTLGDSTDEAAVQRALKLDPANPALEHRLGLVLFCSSERPDFASGLGHLRRAAELSPSEALYWADLASACEASHDAACADRSIERALELSPMTPRLCWTAANYYLRTDRRDRALQLFSRLLELDPGYAWPAFQVCLQMLGAPQALAESALCASRNPRLELALVNFLSSRGDNDAAFAAWHRVSAEIGPLSDGAGVPFTYAAAAPYVNHLIEIGKEREALSVWADLERLKVIADGRAGASGRGGADRTDGGGLIFNGGFEAAPLNSGFDWRYSPSPFLSLEFSNAAAHRGSHSLRLEFTAGRNDEVEPVYQFVAVDPQQSYVLSAFVRSDAITSDSGPRLRVQDAFRPSRLNASGPTSVATSSWHQVRLEFSTGPQTGLVRISLWRPRSRSFPSAIQGVFWLDDVSLTSASSPASPAGRLEAGNITNPKAKP